MGLAEANERGNHRRSRTRLIFTYGTLKKGFSNHRLMEELINTGDSVYVGACKTAEKFPLVCGPYRVPFLLNLPGQGDCVWGELYEVSDVGLLRMDELEGTTRGHYQRLPITLKQLDHDDDDDDPPPPHSSSSSSSLLAEAYFAHPSYAEGLWRRNGHKGYSTYSAKEAKGYIKRKDRPQHLSFLDQISLFLSSPSDSPSS